MLFVSFFSWWYGPGFTNLIDRIGRSLVKTIDQFSIPQLAATLFSPFKQIDAGNFGGQVSIDVAFRRWLDRTFSRFFGAFIRFFTILAGIFVLLFLLLTGLVRLTAWLIVPFTPLAGVIFGIMGVVLWK